MKVTHCKVQILTLDKLIKNINQKFRLIQQIKHTYEIHCQLSKPQRLHTLSVIMSKLSLVREDLGTCSNPNICLVSKPVRAQFCCHGIPFKTHPANSINYNGCKKLYLVVQFSLEGWSGIPFGTIPCSYVGWLIATFRLYTQMSTEPNYFKEGICYKSLLQLE